MMNSKILNLAAETVLHNIKLTLSLKTHGNKGSSVIIKQTLTPVRILASQPFFLSVSELFAHFPKTSRNTEVIKSIFKTFPNLCTNPADCPAYNTSLHMKSNGSKLSALSRFSATLLQIPLK